MSEEKKHYQRPLNFKTGKVEMNFGAGGKAQRPAYCRPLC